MSKIAQEAFQKSLARLEGLTKSQLFHTAGDSNPGNWAGSAPTDEDSMDDKIQENGTDYDGVKKALSHKVAASKALTPAEVKIIKGINPAADISAKIAKGLALTGAERWAIGPKGRQVFGKGEGMDNSPKKDGAAEENKTARDVPQGNVADKNDGKEDPEANPGSNTAKGMDHGEGCQCGKCMGKSLAGAVRQQPTLSKAIDMSPVLHEMTVALGHALEGASERTTKSVLAALAPVVNRVGALEKSFSDFAKSQGEFNGSMGEALVGIGNHVSGNADVMAAAGSQPARGPISAQRPQQPQGAQVIPIQKSFGGPGGLEDGQMALNKSQISAVMSDMVKSGKLNAIEVIKFESTGDISPQVQAAVLNYAQAGQR